MVQGSTEWEHKKQIAQAGSWSPLKFLIKWFLNTFKLSEWQKKFAKYAIICRMYLTRSFKLSRDAISNLIFWYFLCIWLIRIFEVFGYNLVSGTEVIFFLWTGSPNSCLHFEQHLLVAINMWILTAYSRATRAFVGYKFLKIT